MLCSLCQGVTTTIDIKDDQLNIYPSPTKDVLQVSTTNTTPRGESILIYSPSGKLVYHQKYTDPNIDVSNLEPGIYTIQIKTLKTTRTTKFIKI